MHDIVLITTTKGNDMTRKDFELVAATLKAALEGQRQNVAREAIVRVAGALASEFAEAYGAFDPERFMATVLA
jgi:hypothetical protein